ncbi:MAG: hypothetical protein IKN57_13120 [Parasporobacterium sp.]|nr:hypothetical protein [Parasporobacterium sp.]
MKYLEELGKTKGIQLGLSRMRALMEILGDPQKKIRFVHVAGTNGKGSVTAFLESVFISAGYRTGAYTSPAVFSYMEQFRVNGAAVSPEKYAYLVTRAVKAGEKISSVYGMPTRFELETACAFCLFDEENCDIAILEAGLGGDEDATNIIDTTAVSVLTSISRDHCRILGDTLTEIAAHKAGILRKGVPCASAPQEDEVRKELLLKCRETGGGPIVFAAPENMIHENDTESGVILSYRSSRDCTDAAEEHVFGHISLQSKALWQRENLAVSLEAVRLLCRRGYEISDDAVRQGVSGMRWQGRFEIIQLYDDGPGFILDGAHNPQGAAGLHKSLNKFCPDSPLIFVIGVLADKDYDGVIRELFLGRETFSEAASKSCDGDGTETERAGGGLAEGREPAKDISDLTGPFADLTRNLLPRTVCIYTVQSDSLRALDCGSLAARIRSLLGYKNCAGRIRAEREKTGHSHPGEKPGLFPGSEARGNPPAGGDNTSPMPPVIACDNIARALEQALEKAAMLQKKKKDRGRDVRPYIVACGSLSFMKEIRSFTDNFNKE